MWWDKSFSNNLKVGYEIAKSEYERALSRFKAADNKLNMMLVFAAGEITAFATTINTFSETKIKVIYMSLFLAVLFASVLSTIIGLFDKGLRLIDEKGLAQESNYEVGTSNYLAQYIKSYTDCIETIDNKIGCKIKAFRAASILICIDLFIFFAFIILNFLVRGAII